jgi:hypothetical protein
MTETQRSPLGDRSHPRSPTMGLPSRAWTHAPSAPFRGIALPAGASESGLSRKPVSRDGQPGSPSSAPRRAGRRSLDPGRAVSVVEARDHVAVKRQGPHRYNHPVVGEITLEWDALTSDVEPDSNSSSTRRASFPLRGAARAPRPTRGSHRHVPLTPRGSRDAWVTDARRRSSGRSRVRLGLPHFLSV